MGYRVAKERHFPARSARGREGVGLRDHKVWLAPIEPSEPGGQDTGLENRRPFTRTVGEFPLVAYTPPPAPASPCANPFPSATFSLLSTADSMSVVHSWSISMDL